MMAVIIRLQNLPLSANAASIRSFFQGLKIPDGGVNIVGGDDGDAFIAFGTDDDARQAMHLSGQKINGVTIKLLLSSKQEMQTIITEAQRGVLKRNVPVSPVDTTSIQSDKRSITYYNPQSTVTRQTFTNPPSSKIRIIDHSVNQSVLSSSVNNNKENNHQDMPPRPSEFSYKVNRPIAPPPSTQFQEEHNPYGFNAPEFIINDHNNINNNNNNVNNNINSNINNNNINFHTSEQQEFNIPPFNYNMSREPPPRRAPQHENHYNDDHQWPINRSLLPTPPINDVPPIPPMSHRPLPQVPQQPFNIHHDYTEKPQWLKETEESYFEPCSSSLVRIVLPPSIIGPRTVFDLFRNISIVPKKGIKIEQDNDKRLTGYVYVLLVNNAEAAKALRLNNKVFRGLNVSVESMHDSDFEKVADRCDAEQENSSKLLSEKSPYNRDLCVEISNIPLDVTETDLKDYLNISINNKKMHFIKNATSAYCLITASDETMVENILKFNKVSYRGSVLKVLTISKYQLQTFLSNKARDIKPYIPKPLVAARKSTEEVKNVLSCAKLEKLAVDSKPIDLQAIFMPVAVPLQNIIINNTNCIVDFVSQVTCQNVINDLKKKPDISFTIVPITSTEYQSLKMSYLNSTGGVKSVPTFDKRIVRASSPTSQVRIKNFPNTITITQVKDLIRNFQYQPRSVKICCDKGKVTGEVLLTFRKSTEAVDFKDEFHGVWFMRQELEVMLSEN